MLKMDLFKQVFVLQAAGLCCLLFRLRSVVDKCASLFKFIVVAYSKGCYLLLFTRLSKNPRLLMTQSRILYKKLAHVSCARNLHHHRCVYTTCWSCSVFQQKQNQTDTTILSEERLAVTLRYLVVLYLRYYLFVHLLNSDHNL